MTATKSDLRINDLAMVLLVRDDARSGLMPTVRIAELPAVAHRLARLGVPAVKMFASGSVRDPLGLAGTAPDSLMARAIAEIKGAVPELTVMTETCLCSYTPTSDCHLSGPHGSPDVRGTVEALAAQAVAQAQAGADVVGPAAMISGSVSATRSALDAADFQKVEIMPHLIIRSDLYEGYRITMDAMPASGLRAFQVPPDDADGALNAGLDLVLEGANALLLEPALFTVDVLTALATATTAPVLPFSVSGEYNSLSSALHAELAVMLKRAGATRIITYAAADIAEKLTTNPRISL